MNPMSILGILLNKYAKFSTQWLIQKAKNPILITPRIPMPYPFLGSNQRGKMEGHLWVTAIQFAVPSWKPRSLNMKIHSLSQTWLYPVFQIRLTIVIATLMGGCALDHISCRVSLTEKILLKICVINAFNYYL